MAKGKPYTKEFRDNAVRLSMSPGKTVAQAAKELEISTYTLHEWRRKANRSVSGAAMPAGASGADAAQESLEQQNRRLARELEMAREEAAILKNHPVAPHFVWREKREDVVLLVATEDSGRVLFGEVIPVKNVVQGLVRM